MHRVLESREPGRAFGAPPGGRRTALGGEMGGITGREIDVMLDSSDLTPASAALA